MIFVVSLLLLYMNWSIVKRYILNVLRLIENNEIVYKINGIVHKHENLFIKILKNLINLKKILLT